MQFQLNLPRRGVTKGVTPLMMWAALTALAWGAGQPPAGNAADAGKTAASATQQAGAAATPTAADAARARQFAAYSRLPLSFEPNQGQTDPSVKFTSQGRGYTLFLTPHEAVLSLSKPSRPAASLLPGDRAKAEAESSGVLRMKLAGAHTSAQITGEKLLPATSNYYIGNNSRKWLTGVPNYGRVTYHDVYPGVDLVYYGSNQQQLEYDFVVKPGADPRAIGIAFDLQGMSAGSRKASVAVDANGDLLIQGADGVLRFQKPQVYQTLSTANGEGRHKLDGKFVLARGNQVRFALGSYDKKLPLIIDPTLSFSSYLGGSGADSGAGIAVDATGKIDVVGSTSSLNFPQGVAPSARTTRPNGAAINTGQSRVFVSQISATGVLVYTTFVAGTQGDGASAVALDSSNNIYVTGTTHSDDFPVMGSALQTGLQGSSDAFVTILNSGGTITYSTYFGGSGNEDGLAIYVDGNKHIYLGGDTTSTDLVSSFDTPGYQSSYGGGASDGFVAKLTATSGVSLDYVSYFGGSNTDAVTAITADTNGNAYFTGRTSSTDLMTYNPTASGLFPSYGGGPFDVFVAEFSANGVDVPISGYLGGSGDDEATGIALDPLYIATITGPVAPAAEEQTAPRGLPIKTEPDVAATLPAGAGFYSPFHIYVTGSTTNANDFFQASSGPVTNQGGKDVFLVKLAPNAATPVVFSSFVGGSGDDEANGIFLDLSGNAYLVGVTNSHNFPTLSPVQGTCGGGCAGGNSDAFLVRVNAEGTGLVFSTYLGGSGAESGAALAQDANGGTWLTGTTASTNFPTQSPLQASNGGSTDAFVADVAGVNPIRTLPGFMATVLPANDDASTPEVLLGSSFNGGSGLNFFGTTYLGLYINNNGNVTFGAPYSEYTPTGLTTSGVPPIIAPFWADVDTRGVGSGLVTYGNDTVNGFNAFGVNFINVGYYIAQTDKLNSFQLVLIDRHDIAPGDFDIEFNYGKTEWESGDASGGHDGLGGASAHAGYSNGTGVAGSFYEVPGSGVNGAFLDSNTTNGLIYGGNGSALSRLSFEVRAGHVIQHGADVAITLTHTPEPVHIGNQLTLHAAVVNGGPDEATGVTVTDNLPSNVSFVSATSSVGSCTGTTHISCNLGSLANSATATVDIVVTVNSGSTVSDTAEVSATTTDPNASNNTTSTTANVIGGGPVVGISPVNLTFQHNLNLHCPAKPVTLSNTGGQALAISSVVASGSFAVSGNTCGSSLGAGDNCEIDISFTAEAPAAKYTGNLTITDNAPGSPHVVPLSGEVFPPCLMHSSSMSQQVLRSTPTATFNLTDTQPSCHTTATTMACVNTQQATCAFNPPTIAPGGSTVLTVENLNALTNDSLTFTAQGTDKTNTTGVNLSLTLSDFAFTTFPATATVPAGQTANYSVTLTPFNGLEGTVQLTCKGAPQGAACTITPSSVTLAQNKQVQATVAVSTMSRSITPPLGGSPLPGPGRLWLELGTLLALLLLAGWAAVSRRLGVRLPVFAGRRWALSGLVLATLALMLMAWSACGGGGTTMNSNVPGNAGTPAGTYALTVTGTYDSTAGQTTGLTRTQTLTLQVQ